MSARILSAIAIPAESSAAFAMRVPEEILQGEFLPGQVPSPTTTKLLISLRVAHQLEHQQATVDKQTKCRSGAVLVKGNWIWEGLHIFQQPWHRLSNRALCHSGI
jgi:hypothetical protein